jgi:hypothetical protein
MHELTIQIKGKNSSIPFISIIKMLKKFAFKKQFVQLREVYMKVFGLLQQTLPWSRKRPAPSPFFLSPPFGKMPKLDWMRAPQELLPPRPLIVFHQFGGNILTPQQTPVTRVFLGCCDGAPQGSAAVHLSAALKIWPDYMKHKRKLGEFVPMLADKVCALICRQSSSALIDFSALYKSAKELANFVKIMGITNLLFEGFVEDQDNVVTFKVYIVLNFAPMNTLIYVLYI